jgi:oxygen-independent coproporphyrinogen-3 oxidase
MNNKRPLSIYIHIPFCLKRCGYCDFVTFSARDDLFKEYVSCVIKEIEIFSCKFNPSHYLHTIYLGGGTPTILPISYIGEIVDSIITHYSTDNLVEISIEGNPANLTKAYLMGLKNAGINRLSIGVQSAIQAELEILGRDQTPEIAANAVEYAKNIGFSNINLDLLFGIPTQTLESFKRTVEFAIALQPEHLSMYSLCLAPNVPLMKKIYQSLIPSIDDDLAGDMYAWILDWAPSVDFSQYEISNWAKNNDTIDFRCQHNLQYWRNLDYLGIGAGAHSHILHKRWNNTTDLLKYIKGINDRKNSGDRDLGGVDKIIRLSKIDSIKETMMMGLRLTEEGVESREFARRFSIEIEDIYKQELKKLISLGLLEIHYWKGEKTFRLTKKGRIYGNRVFTEFI